MGGLFLVAANEESISSPATSRVCPWCWSHRIEHEKKLVLQKRPGVPRDGPWAGMQGSTGGEGALPPGVMGKHLPPEVDPSWTGVPSVLDSLS